MGWVAGPLKPFWEGKDTHRMQLTRSTLVYHPSGSRRHGSASSPSVWVPVRMFSQETDGAFLFLVILIQFTL